MPLSTRSILVILSHLLVLLFLFYTPVKTQKKPPSILKVRNTQPFSSPPLSQPKQNLRPTKPHPPRSSNIGKRVSTPPPTQSVTEKKSVIRPTPPKSIRAAKEAENLPLPIPPPPYPVPTWEMTPLEPTVSFSNRNSTTEELAIEKSLVSFLSSSLRLPEWGEVTIEFQIGMDGRVEHLVVLKAESHKNERYLQTHLPMLQLPSGLTRGEKLKVTFCNEM